MSVLFQSIQGNVLFKLFQNQIVKNTGAIGQTCIAFNRLCIQCLFNPDEGQEGACPSMHPATWSLTLYPSWVAGLMYVRTYIHMFETCLLRLVC